MLGRLFRDADEKHVSATTGVGVYVGIKIYPSEQLKTCLFERDPVRGFGYLNPPLAETGFMNINHHCNITIGVPKHLIFFGVPPALVPPTATPDYSLNIDIIRSRILKYWEA